VLVRSTKYEAGKILFNFNRLNKFLHKLICSSGCGDVELLPLEAKLGIT